MVTLLGLLSGALSVLLTIGIVLSLAGGAGAMME